MADEKKDTSNESSDEPKRETVDLLKKMIGLRIAISAGVSFVELASLDGWKGPYIYCHPINENIIFWTDMSKEAIAAMQELGKENMISIHPTQFLVYLADGGALRLPLVKSNYKYKTPHWLPVAFNITDKGRKIYGREEAIDVYFRGKEHER